MKPSQLAPNERSLIGGSDISSLRNSTNIRATWNGNTALPSFDSSGMIGSLTGLDGLSTFVATSPTSIPSHFNAIHLPSAEPLLLPSNVSSVSSIRASRQRNLFYHFLIKQSWKEHVQEYFWQSEDLSRRFMKAGEMPRCALFSD